MGEVTRFGRYELEEILGRGHYAEVYRARDSVLDRWVALKVLKGGMIGDDEARKRLLREARVLANLVHARIAWVWDVGEEGGRSYIVMRLVEGKTLDRILPMKWEKALEVVEQVGEGLNYAHEKGLVHRDVKPQNIVVSEVEGAVLTDFGLVRVFTGAGDSSTQTVMGTAGYMAPEVWRNREVGPGADQYALACVLVEMLTGKRLFEGEDTPAVMTGHIMDVPALPEVWPAGVPLGLNMCVGRALEKQASKRYADVRAFVGALRGLSAGEQKVVEVVKTAVRAGVEQKVVEVGSGVGLEFVRVPAGEFLMGSNRRKVHLDEYLIGKYPVTNRQYAVYAYARGVKWSYSPGEEDHPAVNVSGNDASTFCEWVAGKTGLPIRLPTGAEWEKAARGVDGRIYPWGGRLPDRDLANYNFMMGPTTTAVGRYSPEGDSPYGCCDMAGNVWEWCAEKFCRGGSYWDNEEKYLRCAFRGSYDPIRGYSAVGFRVCVSPI